ncbi:MAG: sensory box histidine kinase, partial [uncultured bacterium]
MAIAQLGVILVALYATSFYSYVLFHTLAEIVSVILAVAIFLMAWNSRRYWNNNYYIILGFGFLFVGGIDLLHAFEYKGVGIMQQGGDSNIATQLWLAGRYMIASSFLAASIFSSHKI